MFNLRLLMAAVASLATVPAYDPRSWKQHRATSTISFSGYVTRRAKRPTIKVVPGQTVKKRRHTGRYRARQSKNRRKRS